MKLRTEPRLRKISTAEVLRTESGEPSLNERLGLSEELKIQMEDFVNFDFPAETVKNFTFTQAQALRGLLVLFPNEREKFQPLLQKIKNKLVHLIGKKPGVLHQTSLIKAYLSEFGYEHFNLNRQDTQNLNLQLPTDESELDTMEMGVLIGQAYCTLRFHPELHPALHAYALQHSDRFTEAVRKAKRIRTFSSGELPKTLTAVKLLWAEDIQVLPNGLVLAMEKKQPKPKAELPVRPVI